MSVSFLWTPRSIEEAMKSFVLFALIAICAFPFLEKALAVPSDASTASPKPIKEPKEIKEAASASKDVKDAVKAAKDAKKSKKDCAKECSTEYDPICVHDPTDATLKPRTFGSSCALDVYNCETGKKLVAKSRGECPGSGGARLS